MCADVVKTRTPLGWRPCTMTKDEQVWICLGLGCRSQVTYHMISPCGRTDIQTWLKTLPSWKLRVRSVTRNVKTSKWTYHRFVFFVKSGEFPRFFLVSGKKASLLFVLMQISHDIWSFWNYSTINGNIDDISISWKGYLSYQLKKWFDSIIPCFTGKWYLTNPRVLKLVTTSIAQRGSY